MILYEETAKCVHSGHILSSISVVILKKIMKIYIFMHISVFEVKLLLQDNQKFLRKNQKKMQNPWL